MHVLRSSGCRWQIRMLIPLVALLLTALLAKFKPDMAQFMGMIFFGSWLLLSFIGVGIVALAKKKK